ncbi:MAG: helix-turn-helix domain-containing protein [Paracoccaceae bacterium]
MNTVAKAQDLHPLTRAGFALAAWRAQDISPPEEKLEPVIAALLIGGGGLVSFLPLVDGHRVEHAGGSGNRLTTWFAAVEAGAQNGLAELSRLQAWRIRAGQAMTELSGRTPERLIEVLLELPVLSVEMAAERIGCSRSSARRNLANFAKLGLVRETTGQERYRFWSVRE